MKKTIAILLISVLLISFKNEGPKFKKIFNGHDLTGWIVPEDGCWTVKGGFLHVRSNAEKKGSILWTNTSYKNFIIEADFLMGDGVVDSGIFLRSENDQIQIGISGSLKRDMTASPYLPSLRYPVEANVKGVLKEKKWNRMRIKVVEKTYTVWLNGIEVMTYTSEKIPKVGPIGLQLHPNNEMSIQYKRIKIAEL